MASKENVLPRFFAEIFAQELPYIKFCAPCQDFLRAPRACTAFAIDFVALFAFSYAHLFAVASQTVGLMLDSFINREKT